MKQPNSIFIVRWKAMVVVHEIEIKYETIYFEIADQYSVDDWF